MAVDKDASLRYIRQQLTQLFCRTYPYIQALDKVKDIRKHKAFFRCARCRQEYRRWNIEVDHIQPLSEIKYPKEGYHYELAKYVLHMFDPKNLQVLCRSCHAQKTFFGKQKK